MRPSIPLLLVLGLLLGPAYYAYCIYLSGETAQSVPMTERGDRWVLPDGSILRYHNSLGYKPVTLELSPEMNLVSLRLLVEFPEQATEKPTPIQYQATLQQPDHAALERTLRVAGKPGTGRADFGTVEILYAGQYVFLLEEIGSPANTPGLTLEVREKIDSPNRYVIWIGMTLLLVALVLQIHWLWRASKPLR